MDQDLLRVVIPEACKLILGILGKGESPMLGNSSWCKNGTEAIVQALRLLLYLDLWYRIAHSFVGKVYQCDQILKIYRTFSAYHSCKGCGQSYTYTD